MGKRSDFTRKPGDFYPTPRPIVLKLLHHLHGVKTFAEPMCGDGAIIQTLQGTGRECVFACDLEPKGDWNKPAHVWDVMDTTRKHFKDANAIISNPPWTSVQGKRDMNCDLEGAGSPTKNIIIHLLNVYDGPIWMLMQAGFAHNKYFVDLAPWCSDIQGVGRVTWFDEYFNKKTNKMEKGSAAKEDTAWYCFRNDCDHPPHFHPNYEFNTDSLASYSL